MAAHYFGKHGVAIPWSPLPRGIEIKQSWIDGCGQGIFTNILIPKSTSIGLTHFETKSLMLRTPLGAYLNHSDDPNCERIAFDIDGGRAYCLKPKATIEANTELTLNYSLYDPRERWSDDAMSLLEKIDLVKFDKLIWEQKYDNRQSSL